MKMFYYTLYQLCPKKGLTDTPKADTVIYLAASTTAYVFSVLNFYIENWNNWVYIMFYILFLFVYFCVHMTIDYSALEKKWNSYSHWVQVFLKVLAIVFLAGSFIAFMTTFYIVKDETGYTKWRWVTPIFK